jgi:hypothetical protein
MMSFCISGNNRRRTELKKWEYLFPEEMKEWIKNQLEHLAPGMVDPNFDPARRLLYFMFGDRCLNLHDYGHVSITGEGGISWRHLRVITKIARRWEWNKLLEEDCRKLTGAPPKREKPEQP